MIHAAKIQTSSGGRSWTYLLLKQMEEHHFAWTMFSATGEEAATPVAAYSIEEALRAARSYWKEEAFRTLHCGFLYALPERDEHGNNALFCQMVNSYSSPNGIYFEEQFGHNCLVQFASQEALELWRKLTKKP